ncbi:hypothetical protein [Ethanoligenens harbinense]|uniref:hypothetical protein n=1 Tax=Ethanoligenens harbinense TaxID=253239 RepID=UPI0010C098D3|nr:hypothetical protein [Ethanoligenens harbinense]
MAKWTKQNTSPLNISVSKRQNHSPPKASSLHPSDLPVSNLSVSILSYFGTDGQKMSYFRPKITEKLHHFKTILYHWKKCVQKQLVWSTAAQGQFVYHSAVAEILVSIKLR